jgi:hypothetical protein
MDLQVLFFIINSEDKIESESAIHVLLLNFSVQYCTITN